MPQSPGLGFELLTSNQDSKHVTVNASALILEAVSIGVVVSQTNTPPVSPTNGQLYIVGSAGAGAFLGQDNKLALYDSTTWYFYSPKTNQTLYNTALASYVRFGGSTWSSVSLGGSASPTTTKGDLIVRNATADVRQPVGTDGQVLTADSAEVTGVKWVSPSTGFADPTTTEGDIIIRNASTTTRLPIGTNGQVLTVDTALNGDLKWATPAASTSPTTTKGDLIVRNNITDVRQAIGTDGQVLTADSTLANGLKWASVSGVINGNSLLIKSTLQSTTGIANIIWDSVINSGIAPITLNTVTGVITFPSPGTYQMIGQIGTRHTTANTRANIDLSVITGSISTPTAYTTLGVTQASVTTVNVSAAVNWQFVVGTAGTTASIRLATGTGTFSVRGVDETAYISVVKLF